MTTTIITVRVSGLDERLERRLGSRDLTLQSVEHSGQAVNLVHSGASPALCCAVVAGAFLVFSTFVTDALGRLPAIDGSRRCTPSTPRLSGRRS